MPPLASRQASTSLHRGSRRLARWLPSACPSHSCHWPKHVAICRAAPCSSRASLPTPATSCAGLGFASASMADPLPAPRPPTRLAGRCLVGTAAHVSMRTMRSCCRLIQTASTVVTSVRSTAARSSVRHCQFGSGDHADRPCRPQRSPPPVHHSSFLSSPKPLECPVQLRQCTHELRPQRRQVADRIVLARQQLRIETTGDQRLECLLAHYTCRFAAAIVSSPSPSASRASRPSGASDDRQGETASARSAPPAPLGA